MTARYGSPATALMVIVALGLSGAGVHLWRTHRLEARLLRQSADDIASDAKLVAFANQRGPALYQAHCAQCHGADFKGNTRRGTPNLQDAAWLFGNGAISDIENTIQYGVRSGHPKAHNITDMPAFLRTSQLSSAEISDVVEYVLSLAHQPHDAEAARRGFDVYANQGNCFDCHSSDALGNPDYGAPSLVGPAWVYGGTREALLESVANGRHGLCPAWITRMSPASVRVLAVFLHGHAKR